MIKIANGRLRVGVLLARLSYQRTRLDRRKVGGRGLAISSPWLVQHHGRSNFQSPPDALYACSPRHQPRPANQRYLHWRSPCKLLFRNRRKDSPRSIVMYSTGFFASYRDSRWQDHTADWRLMLLSCIQQGFPEIDNRTGPGFTSLGITMVICKSWTRETRRTSSQLCEIGITPVKQMPSLLNRGNQKYGTYYNFMRSKIAVNM